MVTAKLSLVALVATTTLSVMAFLVAPVQADAFLGGASVSFVAQLPQRSSLLKIDSALVLRGGATAVEEEEEIEIESSDEDEEEEEETDVEEEEELDPKLAKSAQSAASKRKTKAAFQAKAAVSSTLQATAPQTKKKKSSLAKFFAIPYILKACLNPLVVIKMTQGYFASLFNLNYLKDTVDSSANLRSALEQKAKKGGNSSPRGKRKFKPGQAKTLSDLPQLNT